MTQDERWISKYNEAVEFIKTNHRNPSKHDEEGRGTQLCPQRGLTNKE